MDMGYVNIDGQARVFVQTGMQTKPEDAAANAQLLSRVLGDVSTGYIHRSHNLRSAIAQRAARMFLQIRALFEAQSVSVEVGKKGGKLAPAG